MVGAGYGDSGGRCGGVLERVEHDYILFSAYSI